MPINITPPSPSGILTPGQVISWDSNHPPVAGQKWEVILAQTGGVVPTAWFHVYTQDSTGHTAHLYVDDNQVSGIVGIIGNDAPSSVTVELVDGLGAVIDQAQITGTWDPTLGLASQNNGLAQRQSTGGLTEEQAKQLADAQANTQIPLQAQDGSQLVTPINVMIQMPNIKDLVFQATVHTLEGQGTLDAPTVLGVGVAYGMEILVGSVPDGIGRLDGFVLEYRIRIAQFCAIATELVSGEGLVTDILDFSTDRFAWIWKLPMPSHIGFNVTPGCLVTARFLIIGTGG